jgi:hypothetical protein
LKEIKRFVHEGEVSENSVGKTKFFLEKDNKFWKFSGVCAQYHFACG